MRSPFANALLNPANLAMLALSVAAGLCAAWWLFPLGIVLWLLMFVVVFRDPALRMQQAIHERAPLAYRFQQRFDRIERSQISLGNSIMSASASVKQTLQPIQSSVNDLIEQAYQQCLHMTALENRRLVQQRNQNLTEEMALIDAKIATASDAMVKREYEESRLALQGRIKKFQAVASTLDQFEAQLLSLDSALDGIITEAIRLQSMGKNIQRENITDLLAQIEAQNNDLGEFKRFE